MCLTSWDSSPKNAYSVIIYSPSRVNYPFKVWFYRSSVFSYYHQWIIKQNICHWRHWLVRFLLKSLHSPLKKPDCLVKQLKQMWHHKINILSMYFTYRVINMQIIAIIWLISQNVMHLIWLSFLRLTALLKTAHAAGLFSLPTHLFLYLWLCSCVLQYMSRLLHNKTWFRILSKSKPVGGSQHLLSLNK